MGFLVKMNVTKVKQALRDNKEWVLRAAYRGMVKGMQQYNSHVVRAQMSGRKRPDYGIKRPTGTLARSGYVRQIYEPSGGIVRLVYGAKYGVYHQIGGPFPCTSSRGKSYTMNLPKRLYVPEEFQTVGRQLLSQAIAKEIYNK